MNLLNIDSLPPLLQNAATNYSFAAGQRLFRQSDRPSNCYIVASGRVKLVRYTIEGRMVVLQVVRRGECLGADALNSNIYSCTAIAEIESQAIAYPQPLLTKTLQEYPELAEDLTARLVGKIKSLEVSLELLQIRSAHLRLLQYLQYNAAFSSNETVVNTSIGYAGETPASLSVNLDRSWKEVAAELDLAPRTVSRALARLEYEGRITRQAGSITLQIL